MANEITRYEAPQLPADVSRPLVPSSGPVASILGTMQAKRDAKLLSAVAAKTEIATKLRDHQTALVLADVRHRDALALHADQPARINHQLTLTNMERAEAHRTAEHIAMANRKKRETERAQIETVLVDAKQQLEAQKEYGGKGYALVWEQKLHAFLDLKLDSEDKKALIREIRTRGTGGGTPQMPAADADVHRLLLQFRDFLTGAGLDTTQVEKVLNRRKS